MNFVIGCRYPFMIPPEEVKKEEKKLVDRKTTDLCSAVRVPVPRRSPSGAAASQGGWVGGRGDGDAICLHPPPWPLPRYVHCICATPTDLNNTVPKSQTRHVTCTPSVQNATQSVSGRRSRDWWMNLDGFLHQDGALSPWDIGPITLRYKTMAKRERASIKQHKSEQAKCEIDAAEGKDEGRNL